MDLMQAAVEAYSFDLHYVKGLFLHKQYRRCIAKCRGLLKEDLHPLQQTFIQFYLALAHDQLARAIHPLSQAKIPAFSQADRLYKELLEYLSTVEQSIELDAESEHEDGDDPFVEQGHNSRYASSTTLGAAENPRASGYIHSPPVPPRIRSDSLPTNSSVIDPDGTASECEDLESQESYSEIMTPTRVSSKLERDYSSMSLLECQPQPICQGVVGASSRELTRNYLVPPRTLLPGFAYEPPNRPRQQVGSPVQKQMRISSERQSSGEYSAPPVSPLGSESVASGASTISSMSPDTPTFQMEAGTPDKPSSRPVSTRYIIEHLEGIRTQLETHIRLLEEAMQRAFIDQFERAAAIPAPRKRGRFPGYLDAGDSAQHMQQGNHVWSFVPEDVKAKEKKKRIEAGRQRGWTRARFDPNRYMQLAESALAEL